MLSKSRIETQIVSLDNCQFEQSKETVTLTSAKIQALPKTSVQLDLNPLATSYVPKRNTQIKGLIASKPDDGPLGKLITMLANLLKRIEKIFFDKLEEKLPPTIKLKTPLRKKKKSIWDNEEVLEDPNQKQ